MSENKVYRAIGLMSGTSLDGEIDVALIETDGAAYVKPLGFYAHRYDLEVRDIVRACFGKREVDEETRAAEALVTDLHIEAVKASGFEAALVGFHGQTITHDPAAGFTWQLGDGARLAQETGVDTVADFRSADMEAGGQGAPLAPLYHAAILADQDAPVCVLNLGGVGNMTYIGADGALIAFDCGPANAMMDDMMTRLGADYDAGGVFAASGEVDRDVVTGFLGRAYFSKRPPKSLDRNDFSSVVALLPDDPQDAMATLAEMTVQGVVKACEHFPERPEAWYVCGGGRHNTHVMARLAALLGAVHPIEKLERNGDAIEAECFAYLAATLELSLQI